MVKKENPLHAERKLDSRKTKKITADCTYKVSFPCQYKNSLFSMHELHKPDIRHFNYLWHLPHVLKGITKKPTKAGKASLKG